MDPDARATDDTPTDHTPVSEVVAALIRRQGPLRFDRFCEIALYHEPTGFYAAGGRAGTAGGDFITSVEVGPLFARVLGRALDAWWDELGRPDPFVVVDAGAGPGTLARSMRAVAPACAPALTWVLVERSEAQRALHADRLPLHQPWLALPPQGAAGEQEPAVDDTVPAVTRGDGPRFVSLAAMPPGRFTGVVLANELLDNLPTRIVERTHQGWAELYVALDEPHTATRAAANQPANQPADPPTVRFVEQLVPLGDAAVAQQADAAAPEAPVGARVPLQEESARWLRRAIDSLDGGRVVVVDYTATTADLATRPWREWLRTYRVHERGTHPLDHPGTQDITCEVAVDQLGRVRPPDTQETQAAFLGRHGIDALVEEGRARWIERAHIGDLAAIEGRSRIREAEALCEVGGLGDFGVLTWEC
ncbi:MAG: SAM-dependent methyltransferase [Acidimicrobiia bacterium]|nr:SAM-dependent methyltransferase [Acidimicrobiia bacterium]